MKSRNLLFLFLVSTSLASLGQINYSSNQYSRYSSVSYPSMEWYFPVKHKEGPQYIKERGIDSLVILRTKINKKKQKEIIFMNFSFLSSRVTGPKIRVPMGANV